MRRGQISLEPIDDAIDHGRDGVAGCMTGGAGQVSATFVVDSE
jgi:hypothetical protein